MIARTLALSLALAASPAYAEMQPPPSGDAVAGETAFRQCVACHVVADAIGNRLAGRSGRTGPNLYGVAQGAAGAAEGFRYSAALAAAGASGLLWDEAAFIAYIQDPAGFLKTYLGDEAARSNMTFRVRNAEDAADLYAYLLSLAPPAIPVSE